MMLVGYVSLFQVDTNKDRSITWEEFSMFTQSKDFEKDDEWKGMYQWLGSP